MSETEHPLFFVFVISCWYSLRNTSKALDIFDGEKQTHIAIWNQIQRFGSCNLYKRKRISAYKIDEIVINGSSEHHQYNNLQVVIVLVKIYHLGIDKKEQILVFYC